MKDKTPLPANLHKDHRSRVKARFAEHGLAPFRDHEVLELLLFYAVPQKDTNVLAHRLLYRFGNLPAVFSASAEELCKVEGIGEHVATLLRLMLPVAARVLSGKEDEGVERIGVIPTAAEAGDFFVRRFAGETQECIYLMLLDNARRGMACMKIAEGNINSSAFSIRSVLEPAVLHRAASCIIAHNHPGGVAIPSADDVATTAQLVNALASFGIPLLDHIVVAGADYISVMKKGDARYDV